MKFSEPVCPNRFHSKRLDAECGFERENLDPDEFGQYRVDAEERGKEYEQALRFFQLHRAYFFRLKGILSGATAPPEMMKDIAWSAVQSVGISWLTGTISR